MKKDTQRDLGGNKEFMSDLKRACKSTKRKSAINPNAPQNYGPAMRTAYRNTKVLGAPVPKGGFPKTVNPSWAKQKSTKKKVSKVLQEKSKRSMVKQKHSAVAMSGLKKFVAEEGKEKKGSKKRKPIPAKILS